MVRKIRSTSDSPPPYKHLHHFGVVVVEEEALAGVEGCDGLHIVVAEREVEDVEVLGHALDVDRLRYDDDAPLNQPAECHLGHALAVLMADGLEHGVGEEAVASFGKRPPRHDAAAESVHVLAGFGLLVEYVGLDLIHHRRNLDVARQVDEVVGIEVAHADGAQFAVLVGVLEGAVCAVAVAEGLVEEHQVDVVRAQAAQALVD